MKTKEMAIISIAFVLLIIIIANFMFYNNLDENFLEVKEGKLIKNKGLAILSGEKYAYYLYNNEGVIGNLEFSIKSGMGCLGVDIFTDYSGVCIKSDGTDSRNSNISFVHPQVAFFKPWMLALEEGWNWKVEYIDKQTDNVIESYIFEVIKEEKIFGRNSYLVEVTNEEVKVKIWVDKEKRVLLKEINEEYIVEIYSAPFELEKDD
ncbi:MAG: hypothetical protein PHU63_00150 [Candidatus ainarchaeum sp.]|nr:hypothetical protein [Candidatus ainarchaeum sp.]